MWCKVVMAEAANERNGRKGKSRRSQGKAAVRASITFRPDLYETLEEIAHRKKCPGRVLRAAAEKYIVNLPGGK